MMSVEQGVNLRAGHQANLMSGKRANLCGSHSRKVDGAQGDHLPICEATNLSRGQNHCLRCCQRSNLRSSQSMHLGGG